MGLMSLIYHMSNFYLTQVLDFVGMFLCVGWALGLNLARLKKIQPEQIAIVMAILVAVLTGILHLMYLAKIRYQVLILLAALAIIATEYAARTRQQWHYRWFVVTLALLSIAFGFSVADGVRFWCTSSAHGWFSQGHALWHWISSLAMLTLYLHYSQQAHSSSTAAPKGHR
jgi:4-amino-4-deoxy-L-arabinose transferase-like glycosyltransferase